MTDFEVSTPALGAQQLSKMTDDLDRIAVDASSTADDAAEVKAELQEAAADAGRLAESSAETPTRPSTLNDSINTEAVAQKALAPAPGAEETRAVTTAAAATVSDAAAEPEANESLTTAADTAAVHPAASRSVQKQPVHAVEQAGSPDRLQQEQQDNAELEAAISPGAVAVAKGAFLSSQKSAEKVLSPRTSGSNAHSNGVTAASLDYTADTPVVKVRELRQQLSATHIPLTGGLHRRSSDGKEEVKRGPSPALSEHDKINTANVAELLKTAEYKLVPEVDVVPYEQLIKLRLEDGIDVTRKEAYLSAAEFNTILGMDKAAFGKLPQWKKLQIKKAKLLF